MKQTINQHQFIESFRQCGRYDQFGYDALVLLFDYLEQLEEDCGEELELDPIEICCEYSVDSPKDIAANYGIDLTDCETNSDVSEIVTEYLEEHTQVVGGTPDGKIVYLQF